MFMKTNTQKSLAEIQNVESLIKEDDKDDSFLAHLS